MLTLGCLALTGAATAAAVAAPTCATVHGFSWPGSAALPHPHLSNVSTVAGCCAACAAAGCGTWTLHPSNGCWLHGPLAKSPVAVRCGDGDACVTGSGPGQAPPPPIPAGPPGPPAPPSPSPLPRPTALATPSEAHLRFHEDNIGAISHFGMQTFAPKNQRHAANFATNFPPASFTPTSLSVDQWVSTAASFGAKYYVLVTDHFSGFSLYPTTAHDYSIAHSPACPSRNIIADFVKSCLKHGVRPAFYYSVHENWYYNVSGFNLTNPSKQAAFEDMAMQQLVEIAQIFVDGGAEAAEIWL